MTLLSGRALRPECACEPLVELTDIILDRLRASGKAFLSSVSFTGTGDEGNGNGVAVKWVLLTSYDYWKGQIFTIYGTRNQELCQNLDPQEFPILCALDPFKPRDLYEIAKRCGFRDCHMMDCLWATEYAKYRMELDLELELES